MTLANATRDTAFAHLARGVNEPKPGSPEADERGCLCPIIDNHHGKGRFGTGEQHGWWINADCRLHNKEAKP